MAQENTNATEGYQMKTGWGTIAMLISATGMGLVPLFSRWATCGTGYVRWHRLNAGDSIGALLACGRMAWACWCSSRILMVATHKVKTLRTKLTPAIALGGLMIGMSLRACYVTSTLLTRPLSMPYCSSTPARDLRVGGPHLPRAHERPADLPARRVHRHAASARACSASAWRPVLRPRLQPETSTPEFPRRRAWATLGLLSGLFWPPSMFFFNGYRKDADTTARGVWNSSSPCWALASSPSS